MVPAQFVFFNLSAILGSAILYGDFKEATFHQLVTFFYGCAATFGGVYLIALSTGPQEEEPTISDPELSTVPTTPDVRLGAIGRRNRHLAMLDAARSSPTLRRKPSTSSLVGFSPAQVGNLPLKHASGADYPCNSAYLLCTHPWKTMTSSQALTPEGGPLTGQRMKP